MSQRGNYSRNSNRDRDYDDRGFGKVDLKKILNDESVVEWKRSNTIDYGYIKDTNQTIMNYGTFKRLKELWDNTRKLEEDEKEKKKVEAQKKEREEELQRQMRFMKEGFLSITQQLGLQTTSSQQTLAPQPTINSLTTTPSTPLFASQQTTQRTPLGTQELDINLLKQELTQSLLSSLKENMKGTAEKPERKKRAKKLSLSDEDSPVTKKKKATPKAKKAATKRKSKAEIQETSEESEKESDKDSNQEEGPTETTEALMQLWKTWLTNRTVGLNSKKDWLAELEMVKKYFRYNVSKTVLDAYKRKDPAIKTLAWRLAREGPPGPDLFLKGHWFQFD